MAARTNQFTVSWTNPTRPRSPCCTSTLEALRERGNLHCRGHRDGRTFTRCRPSGAGAGGIPTSRLARGRRRKRPGGERRDCRRPALRSRASAAGIRANGRCRPAARGRQRGRPSLGRCQRRNRDACHRDDHVARTRDRSARAPLLVAHVDDEHFRNGAYEFRAHAVDQAGNEASTGRRSDGSAATLRLPARIDTRLAVGVPRTVVRRKSTRRHGTQKGYPARWTAASLRRHGRADSSQRIPGKRGWTTNRRRDHRGA